MRGAGKFSAALVAALMVLLAAASGAGAAKQKLVLKDYGTPAAPGWKAGEQLTVTHNGETCYASTEGIVETNTMVKDQLSFYPFYLPFCLESESPEYKISQGSTGERTSKVTIASNGQLQVSLTPKLAITMPGPCTYEWSKLKLTFTPGGPAESPATSIAGKLHKAGSSPACNKREAATFQDDLYSKEKTTLTYETELVP
ncbi:MAG TPA: hypothetical protein VNV44_04035 [Solirubrobacteraceae bacterium]|jgi:hypothetical protein|nr:hypothetical protein [Solirubrobacteraceae bacterium]